MTREDVMREGSTLPPGWVWTTIGEATDTLRMRADPQSYPESKFIGMEHVEAHTMRLLGTVSAREMRSSAERFMPGDVLYGRLRPYLNKVFCPDFAGLCSGEFIVFRKVPHLESRFLQYFLNSADFMSFASHLNAGDRPRVNFDQLADYPFPLAPLSEQHRIVAEIEKQFTRLDAGVAVLKRVQVNLRRYRASVLKAACEGRLAPQDPADEPADRLLARILAERRAKWEAAYPGKNYVEPAAPEMDGLPALPVRWCWAALPQVGELARGKSKHRPRNDPRLYGGHYPFIQTGEIKQADGTIAAFTQTYNEFGLAQSRLWPKGTLCITIAANIAETAILGLDACFPDSVVGLIAAHNACDVRFVEYFIRTVKDDLERYAPATAQKNINLDTLQKLAVALPPLPEQHRIVAEVERRLSVVQEVEATVAANLARAGRLRQAVLKQAFEGRIAPPDKSDDPSPTD